MSAGEGSRTGKETVLFICSFNSVRSQIAEGLLRARCGNQFEIWSAGIAPAGLNRNATAVMKEIGIDIANQRSKAIKTLPVRTYTHVVTLCDHARLALAGSLPEGEYVHHRGFNSPSEIRKKRDELVAEYRTLRNDIGAYLEELFPDCDGRLDSEKEP